MSPLTNEMLTLLCFSGLVSRVLYPGWDLRGPSFNKQSQKSVSEQSSRLEVGKELTAWSSSMFMEMISSLGFPSGSGGKESACNAGDLDLIPG